MLQALSYTRALLFNLLRSRVSALSPSFSKSSCAKREFPSDSPYTQTAPGLPCWIRIAIGSRIQVLDCRSLHILSWKRRWSTEDLWASLRKKDVCTHSRARKTSLTLIAKPAMSVANGRPGANITSHAITFPFADTCGASTHAPPTRPGTLLLGICRAAEKRLQIFSLFWNARRCCCLREH